MLTHSLKLLSAIILITATSLQAQNYNDAIRLSFPGLGSNARALGMGNAFNALSDDASASYFNPAGFGLLKKIELSGGLSYLDYHNSTTFFGNQTEDNNTNTTFNRISMALPFPTYKGSLVFGFSYHNSKDLTSIVKFNGFNGGNTSWINYFSNQNNDIPYDLWLSYPLYNSTDNYIKDTTLIGGQLNQSGNTLNSGSINNWTFSGAIEVQKNFFIGANFTFYSGNFESNKDYYEDDTKDNYTSSLEIVPGYPLTRDFKTFYLNNTINWDIGGWDAKVGFLYQFEDVARFGGTVQFPKIYYIDEEFLVNGSSEFGTGQMYFLDQQYYSDRVSYDIITPFELNLAGAVNLKGIILSAEVTFMDYSQLEFKNSEGLSSSYISDVNKSIKEVLRSAVNYNIGFEYTVPMVGLKLRGGYLMQQSPFEGDNPEFNHQYVTGGLGFLANGNIGIDVAYAYGWWNDIGDNYGSNVSRTFQEISTHNLILTTTLRF